MNIPNVMVNNGKDKDVKPFIAPRSTRMVDIYFPDGGEFGVLNVECNTMICLMHPYKKYVDISFTEIKNPNKMLYISDKVHIITNQSYNNKKKHLRNINITDDSNIQKQSTNDKIDGLVTTGDACNCSTKIDAINKAIDGTGTGNTLSYSNEKDINTRLTNLEGTVGDEDSGLEKDVNTLKVAVGSNEEGKESGIFGNIKTINTNIDTINDKIGEVKKDEESIVPLQTQITTLDEQINNENDGLIKQIEDIKDEATEGTLANRIKGLEDNKCNCGIDIEALKKAVGTIPEGKDDLQTQVNTINSSISTINTTIGKDDNTGLRKRIKDLESIDWANKIINLMKNNNGFKEKIHYILHPILLTGNCNVKWDWNNEQQYYTYSNLKCNNCDNNTDTTLINSDETRPPSEIFSTLYCETCKHNFTAQNIDVTSYLYPYNTICSDYGGETTHHCIQLLCSICKEFNGFIFTNKEHDDISNEDEVYLYSSTHKCKISSCNTTIYYDKTYVIDQLSCIKSNLNDNCTWKKNQEAEKQRLQKLIESLQNTQNSLQEEIEVALRQLEELKEQLGEGSE